MTEPIQIDTRRVDVAKFKSALAEHTDAMRKYKAHIAAGGQYHPPPDADPLVKAALDEATLEPRYVLVGPTLEERRAELYGRVNHLHEEAAASLMPPGKRRVLLLDYHDALAKKKASRSDADKAVIAAVDGLNGRLRLLDRHAAALMAEIDDLDRFTVEGWTPSPFPV